jgi:hypothetical protein
MREKAIAVKESATFDVLFVGESGEAEILCVDRRCNRFLSEIDMGDHLTVEFNDGSRVNVYVEQKLFGEFAGVRASVEGVL